jgi:hypothetical protein
MTLAHRGLTVELRNACLIKSYFSKRTATMGFSSTPSQRNIGPHASCLADKSDLIIFEGALNAGWNGNRFRPPGLVILRFD